MSSEIENLKKAIENAEAGREEKQALMALAGKIEKEMRSLSLRAERSAKERHTLSTLLARTSEDLEHSLELLKSIFGRYITNEVVSSLLENPSALEMGGERRSVTIMMTDLRGFTALSERLEPERAIQMLNNYLEVMVEIILRYNGNINEIIGDALLVIFGAPQKMEDRARVAVACAIEMQNAMERVNRLNAEAGFARLEMGIGLHDADVIVGNIGSLKRTKYGVVGSGVNMAGRIESYTLGGQVLVSESVRKEAGEVLRIDRRLEIFPKGSEKPVHIYEVGGIGGTFNMALESGDQELTGLSRRIPVLCTILSGKHVSRNSLGGEILQLSGRGCEIALDRALEPLTNMKLNLEGVSDALSAKDVYGKIVSVTEGKPPGLIVRFTAVPPEIDGYFQGYLALSKGSSISLPVREARCTEAEEA